MESIAPPFSCTSMCSSIMDSMPDGVFTIDKQWRITFFNRSAELLTGVPAKTAVGRTCLEVFQTRDCDGACVLRACMEQDQHILHRRMTILRRDGTPIHIDVSAAPLKDDQGQIIGGVETFRPLTGLAPPAVGNESRTAQEFCTRDPHLSEVVRILPQIAESEATVLLLGESGTGKELFARAIHRLSGRAKGPFVPVNCGALPEHLMESELFGYKAGAFTDARKDKPGRFELAEGGTLLLDEIGDLPYALQAKILRVLQERVYDPLGGVRSERANVRVVASTNRDLARMVEEGTFRGDLYYRLNVVQFKLPPLRDRSHDIPLLVANALAQRRGSTPGKQISGVTPEVMRILTRYDYPGNIRELENIIEYACILCPGGLIESDHLPRSLRPNKIGNCADECAMTMEEIRLQAAQRAVRRNQGNRNAACRELGITKDTLRRILRGADEGEK